MIWPREIRTVITTGLKTGVSVESGVQDVCFTVRGFGLFSKAAENKYVSQGLFVLCKSVLRHTDGCNFLQLSGLNEALDELQTMLESSNLPKKII